ncbi:MAG: hypothetical protein MMC23_001447 [Stictis urceolatum]|nr:hypothetical protein [Stictis urceolata]
MATLNPLIVTFNCGRELIKPDVFARHLVETLPGVPSPEILVLSLQEVAPIAYAFLGGSFLATFFARFNRAIDIVARSWSEADEHRYVTLITRNVGMTAIMVFIRADVVDRVRWIEEGGIGVGWYETGNKGCVGVRLGYSVDSVETLELTFLAAHLAPMEDQLQKRNQDWQDVVQGLVFTPTEGSRGAKAEEQTPLLSDIDDGRQKSGIYTGTSYLFLAGDLNYRTSITKPLPEDRISFPQPTDQSDSQHYSNLLKHDQLRSELEAGRTAHGFSEASIRFPPTYKYSDQAREAVEKIEGSITKDTFDSSQWGWALHRWPSWCDRILYLDIPPWMKSGDRSSSIVTNVYTAIPLMSTSDHRPVALSLSLPLRAIPPPPEEESGHPRVSPPFGIDPTWRERRTAARHKEIALGLFSYFGLTWEGNTIVLGTLIGVLGGWAIVRSMLME